MLYIKSREDLSFEDWFQPANQLQIIKKSIKPSLENFELNSEPLIRQGYDYILSASSELIVNNLADWPKFMKRDKRTRRYENFMKKIDRDRKDQSEFFKKVRKQMINDSIYEAFLPFPKCSSLPFIAENVFFADKLMLVTSSIKITLISSHRLDMNAIELFSSDLESHLL